MNPFGNKLKAHSIKYYESGKKKFFIITLLVLIIGYLLNLLTYWDIYYSYHKVWDIFALCVYALMAILYFTKYSSKYRQFFLITSSMFMFNMVLSHLIFYPKEFAEQLQNLFSRDAIFITCIIALTGYIVDRVHVIWQTATYVLLLAYYFFFTEATFINENFGLYIITGVGYSYICYIIYGTLNKFITGLNKYRGELEFKNKQITDSIRYAQRIQTAILPPMKTVKKHLKQSFILYKPKDIVAGDFYWFEMVDDTLLFAVADCTGHGVPGAMVSVVCNNALNRSVREYGLTDPGEILQKTNEIVIEEFEKSDEEVNDGMDIALCTLKGNQLKFSGAQNPVWIYRNEEIIITKGTKQPIGRFAVKLAFETHCFEVQKNDVVYLFSDGYNDQFGGPSDRKFMAGNMRKLIKEIGQNPISEQYQSFESTFDQWKGDNEQIDDVCVMGIQF